MSQFVELPDAVYDALQRQAEQEGTTPAKWIAEKLPSMQQSMDTESQNASPSAWDVLDALAGTVDAPEDWSAERDRLFSQSR